MHMKAAVLPWEIHELIPDYLETLMNPTESPQACFPPPGLAQDLLSDSGKLLLNTNAHELRATCKILTNEAVKRVAANVQFK